MMDLVYSSAMLSFISSLNLAIIQQTDFHSV